MLSKEVKDIIRQQTFLGLPNEICGLLVYKNDQIFTYQCKNISRNPSLSFIIDPKDCLKVSLEEGEIVASYHSHTNDFSDFSDLDKVNANEHEIRSILYFFKEDKFFEYVPNKCKNPYIGRYFELGKNDCFSLIRDYFNRELHIQINDYLRDKNWSIRDPFLYDENFRKEKFLEISGGAIENLNLLKKNDVILMNLYGKTSTHAAIYLGNGTILHHPRGYSKIEELNDFYKRRSTHILRHESFVK